MFDVLQKILKDRLNRRTVGAMMPATEQTWKIS
jgi:hypothetical protein